ncbi:MAG: N-acetylmuramic acid 6-phosphate etherase [Verrucomicrobiae bacterium]|nr:N-acetylmuramic acid 6-phosphate etherase [Verrucomicrobiae bacterium]
MPRNAPPPLNPARCVLGIECGATHSVAVLGDPDGGETARGEFAAANLRLLSDAALKRHLRRIAARFPGAMAVGIGMAGVRTDADRERLRRLATDVWPRESLWVGNDLETALAAAPTSRARVSVLVLSGTGSCCFGRSQAGESVKAGGWGHVLGDRGSGHAIGLAALRVVLEILDRQGTWPELGAGLLRALAMNEPGELVDWSVHAAKPEIAALAVEVFQGVATGDRLCRGLLSEAAAALVTDAQACARQLAGPDEPVQFVLAGGCLLRCPYLARQVKRGLLAARSGAEVRILEEEGARGAMKLAVAGAGAPGEIPTPTRRRSRQNVPSPDPVQLPEATGLPPTEERNPRSMNLDRMSLRAAVGLMLAEEDRVSAALAAVRVPIERTVRIVARALQQGGRLFYVGAGTSGRLGVLDASECPPTFRADPAMVQGIIAGGQRALWAAVEGAEDDFAAGAEAMGFRRIGAKDVVMGIAASGRTRFVWGALQAAREVGAATVLLCFNPNLRHPAALRPTVRICPDTGPELLTGSTRLKAGTATKRVLNIITTLAMVRLGKVAGNLMVDLNPSNRKLRERAVRIVRELTGAGEEAARMALTRQGWVVKQALQELGRCG